tara:strand:+ start:198 stop:410 length:213 start_codon:yes stop_codon:yes gene_type:complete
MLKRLKSRRGFVRNSTKVVAMVVIEGDLITVAAVTVAGVAVVDRAWPAPGLNQFKKQKKRSRLAPLFCVS